MSYDGLAPSPDPTVRAHLEQVARVEQAGVNLGRGLVALAHHKNLSRRVS